MRRAKLTDVRVSFMGARKRSIVVLLTTLLCTAAGRGHAAEPTVPLVVERTIALKGVSGRIDHLAVDLGRKHMFVAELGNGTVDVIDLTTGTVIHRIVGLKEPQGPAYAPGADVLAVASAGDGSVRLFRGAELADAGTIDFGDDADNIRLDPRSGNLVVGYGSGGLAVIDPAKALVRSRILLLARISHTNWVHRGPESSKVLLQQSLTAKQRSSPMPTECNPKLFEFAPVEGRRVVAAFDGGTITSDAGAVLLGETDRAIRLTERFASCFTDVPDVGAGGTQRRHNGDAARGRHRAWL